MRPSGRSNFWLIPELAADGIPVDPWSVRGSTERLRRRIGDRSEKVRKLSAPVGDRLRCVGRRLVRTGFRHAEDIPGRGRQWP